MTTFRLAKAYDPAMFEVVKPEIEAVAGELAAKLRAKRAERTVTVAGEPALQFDLAHDGRVEQVTFVLHGRTEYQLYCAAASSPACRSLVATFTPR